MPDSFGAFIKASLGMHVLKSSPSGRFHVARCSTVPQTQPIKIVKHSPFICIAIFLF